MIEQTMIQAIHHVQITVPAAQLEECMRFYRDTLGLPLAPRPADMGRDGYWLRVFDRDLHLGIEEGVDRSKTRAHVAFKVDDLGAMRERLAQLGVEMKTPAGMAGYERLHLRDPAGNMVELIQPTVINMDVDRRPWPKVHLSVALLHEGRLLLVREAKPASRDKWNLPGGHAERGESAVEGALRELFEEAGVVAQATGVLGLFSSRNAVRIVILATAADPQPIAGDEISESRFWSIDEAQRLTDDELLAPVTMRMIFDRLARSERYPLELIGNVFM